MTQIFQVDFTKADLAEADPDALMLAILAGHASNEVQTLQRALLMVMNGLDTDQHANLPGMAQSMLFIRLLCARISAAWEDIGRDKYQQLLDAAEIAHEADELMAGSLADCRRGREVLARSLGAAGLVGEIRKKAGAHTDRARLRAALDDLPDDHAFSDLLAPFRNNALYGFADELSTRVVLNLAAQDDELSAIESVSDEVFAAAGALADVCDFWIQHFYRSHLARQITAATREPVDIRDAMDLGSVRFPAFIKQQPE